MTREATPDGVVRAFEGDPARPDVWIFERTAPHFVALADRGPVSPEEVARAARLADPDAGVGLLARRAAVRRVLGLYLGRPAASVRVVTLPGGKPTFLPERDDRWRLAYSCGHSGDLFCVAVGTASSLGLDVERERPVSRAASIASRWFSAAEARALSEAPEEERAERFLDLWTAKEALAKRHAAGLRLMSGRGDDLDVGGETTSSRLVRFRPRNGYVGAVASTSPVLFVRSVVEPCRFV